MALPVLLVAALRIAGVDPLERIEARVYDGLIVPLLPTPIMSDRIAIIEVDDRTLTDLGAVSYTHLTLPTNREV